jgi:hypothetical protein
MYCMALISHKELEQNERILNLYSEALTMSRRESRHSDDAFIAAAAYHCICYIYAANAWANVANRPKDSGLVLPYRSPFLVSDWNFV